MFSRTLAWWLVGWLSVMTAARSAAQSCPVNPTNGPNMVTLVSKAGGTDLDIGTTGKYHDIAVPAGSTMQLCLSNCDGLNDTLCDASAGTLSVVGTAFGPPAPFIIGNTGVCLSTTFSSAPSGTADVSTGALHVVAPLAANAYAKLSVSASTVLCPRCTGAEVGDLGTCDGTAANPGADCTVDQIVTVQRVPQGGDPVYPLSRQCLPAGAPTGSIALDVTFETKAVTAGACSGQTSANGCSPSTSASCHATCTSTVDGISQTCCANDTTLACFPASVTRTGSTAPPAPPLPSTSYPKIGDAVLAAATCVPAVGPPVGFLVNVPVGLPGPGAMIVPITQTWTGGGPPIPTTTSTSLLPPPTTTTTSTSAPPATTTSTTIPACSPGSPPAGCDATDPCRVPSCPNGTCQYADATGVAAVSCRMITLSTIVAGSTVDQLGGPKGQKKIRKALNAAAGKVRALNGATGNKVLRLAKKTAAKVRAFVNLIDTKLAATLDPALRQQLGDLGRAMVDRLGSLTGP